MGRKGDGRSSRRKKGTGSRDAICGSRVPRKLRQRRLVGLLNSWPLTGSSRILLHLENPNICIARNGLTVYNAFA